MSYRLKMKDFMMRFSLRTILLAIVFLGLVLSLITTKVQLENIRQKHFDFRRTAGFLVPDGDDWYQVWQLGDMVDNRFVGSTIVQVEDFERYSLKMTFYDGVAQATKTQSFALTDPETAITFLQQKTPPRLLVQSNTIPLNNFGKLHEYFLVDVGSEDTFYADGLAKRTSISDKPVCYYYFRPSDNKLDGPEPWELREASDKELLSLCKKYHLRCVSISLAPRNH